MIDAWSARAACTTAGSGLQTLSAHFDEAQKSPRCLASIPLRVVFGRLTRIEPCRVWSITSRALLTKVGKTKPVKLHKVGVGGSNIVIPRIGTTLPKIIMYSSKRIPHISKYTSSSDWPENAEPMRFLLFLRSCGHTFCRAAFSTVILCTRSFIT